MKNTIWAPWRGHYVTEKKAEGCVFCGKLAENDDTQNLILHRGYTLFAVMNLYPYNAGHIMLLPKRHIDNYVLMTEQEAAEMSALLKTAILILKKVFNPEGFNVGYNMGSAAGAGIAGHLHQHIIPRWNGDTNFMPVIGDTKIISETLYDTYAKLKKEFDRI